MKYIWFFMIITGVLAAIINGNIDKINGVVITNTQDAVMLAIGLIGVMSVWLGLMNIAKKSGLIRRISVIMNPLIRLLFPDIPKNHPAIGSIVMNIVANMFGAGNSATALGIKAMEEMQKINPRKERATNAMCMFLVVNMSSVQLVPLSVLKIRADAGSLNPTEIIATSLISTTISTIVGIIAAKLLERVFIYD
ncbi:nucleoside recognition domain-containing protein [Anaeromicrobium sediminis]|uniref:Spore maturation protein n=1 Tax=Anaeromicrobium sediminis TaxID=1478221 RepID=A0A267MES7_9FIRM|nr:nucleoside recognition domain-containing protein [Anaeromicrobium sediminis]PAB58084.1 spore maturation protein [Anaeromicrobium sediminis]